jgi:hypothetical protein
MRDEVIATALEELENAGLIERTGVMRSSELSCEWQRPHGSFEAAEFAASSFFCPGAHGSRLARTRPPLSDRQARSGLLP